MIPNHHIDTEELSNKLASLGYRNPASILTSPSLAIFAFNRNQRLLKSNVKEYSAFLESELVSRDSVIEMLTTESPHFQADLFDTLLSGRMFCADRSDNHGHTYFFSETVAKILAATSAEGLSSDRARHILVRLGITIGKTTLRNFNINGTLTADRETKGGHRRYLLSSLLSFYLGATQSTQQTALYFSASKYPEIGLEPKDLYALIPNPTYCLSSHHSSPTAALKSIIQANPIFKFLVIRNSAPQRLLGPLIKSARNNNLILILTPN